LLRVPGCLVHGEYSFRRPPLIRYRITEESRRRCLGFGRRNGRGERCSHKRGPCFHDSVHQNIYPLYLCIVCQTKRSILYWTTPNYCRQGIFIYCCKKFSTNRGNVYHQLRYRAQATTMLALNAYACPLLRLADRRYK